MNVNDDFTSNPLEQEAYRVAYLVAGYIRSTLTDSERDELDEWVTASDANMLLFAEMTNEKNIEKGLKERNLFHKRKAFERIKKGLNPHIKKHPLKKINYWALGIAASLILIAGVLFLTPQKQQSTQSISAINDLQPGSEKAMLTLPDGRHILLDSAHGQIFQKGDLHVVNSNGSLQYRGKTKEIQYHKLLVPKGGQYKLVLPDGTIVWMNAASSIKYPVAFTGNERRVELTGEAYFEVTHDASKPFKVSTNEMELTVLGTRFNVNAYDDEASMKVTLLEGSVKVSTGKQGSNSIILKPNQQAVLTPGGQLRTTGNVNPDEIVAWKNGLFEFKDEPIESIMRQVARWYDVTINYEGKMNAHFNASIERDVPASKLLHLLELTNRVHFEINNKTIIVKP